MRTELEGAIYRKPRESAWGGLVPLHATQSREKPLVCLPGAGASVTTFVGLIDALGPRWPVYGVQPRGIDMVEPPHESIEGAATYALELVKMMLGDAPVHLLGHSHGGRVAFEMALMLQSQGRPVASLTLVDSEPPRAERDVASDSQIYREFVGVFEKLFDKDFGMGDDVVTCGKPDVLLGAMHAALTAQGCLPNRSSPAMLEGPLAGFMAAKRCTYKPQDRFEGELRLVLVRDIDLPSDEDMKQRDEYAAKWRAHTRTVDLWHGPGHHFSILQAPHVQSLAAWWREGGGT